MENITGYIVDLTDEKRGPVKFYKRFTIITTEQEKISGWIFSSTSFHETTIENTLTEVIKKQTAVTIKGKITTETGDKRIMRIFLKNKHDQPISIAKVHGKFPSSAIADESLTNILIVYDQLIDTVELNKNYTFTNIKTKKIYNTLILTTTSNTTVSEIQNEINTNLDDLNETMSMDLTDILTVSTIIDEARDVKEEKSCSICRENMIPLISKPNLIKCVNCKKIMVINKDNMQISMTIEIGDGIKLTFWTIKGLLKIFIQQQQPDEQMNNEDIS
ncbi:unnamed protein product [Rotaria magnacalcarata]|uniref:Uncharacterized protein n=1 Tax=Rotaria magnacalcarata TaxID=392030 RepID=A0A8S2UZX8_9BILA|nr:unnamed protein product [Rotaria magnacalcarata]